VTWGVGYFFSPADIINLERVDPEDPERDREGPVSLRIQVPFAPHLASLYVLPPVGERTDYALAGRADIAVERFEFGFGGYWEHERATSGTLTATGSIGRVSVFGEASLRDSIERRYVEETDVTPETPLGLELVTREGADFAATVGLRYSPRNPTGKFGITTVVQYYFNADGYPDSEILRERADEIPLLFADGLTASDLVETGRHYTAAQISWREIVNTPISATVFWLSGFTDLSGSVTASLSWEPWDHVRLGGEVRHEYGLANSELAPEGRRLSATLSASVGAGRF
jgi:hypothetical protein